MSNSIVILAVLSCMHFSAQESFFTKKDTLVFAPDSSYSRSFVRNGNYLVFATSKNGIIQLNEKTGATKTLLQPSASGEFRSVISKDDLTLGMIAGDNGEIWLYDGNNSLLEVDKKGLFFDDIDQYKNTILILGDPLDGEFSIFLTDFTTHTTQAINGPKAIGDEACYAASGTTVLHPADSTILFISGGSQAARYHRTDDLGKTWQSIDLPMKKGEGCGPFSLHITGNQGMIIGGCYKDQTVAQATSLYSTDGGNNWVVSEVCTNGYRSCVTGTKKVQFACGSNGIDISYDGGKHWKPFDKGNFCALLLEKKYLYATTTKGKCIRYALAKI